jgi:hypothetical protein
MNCLYDSQDGCKKIRASCIEDTAVGGFVEFFVRGHKLAGIGKKKRSEFAALMSLAISSPAPCVS